MKAECRIVLPLCDRFEIICRIKELAAIPYAEQIIATGRAVSARVVASTIRSLEVVPDPVRYAER